MWFQINIFGQNSKRAFLGCSEIGGFPLIFLKEQWNVTENISYSSACTW